MDLVHPDDVPATLAEVGKLSEGLTTLRFVNRYRAYRLHLLRLPQSLLGLGQGVRRLLLGRDVPTDRARTTCRRRLPRSASFRKA
jgi:hypothetical protein